MRWLCALLYVAVAGIATGAHAQVTDEAALPKTFGRTDSIQSIALTPDRRFVLSGSRDFTVKVWRVSDGQLVRVMAGHTDHVYGVIVTPNGESAISCGKDATVRVWRLSDGQLLRNMVGHSDAVRAVAITTDGQTVVSGGDDGDIRIWRLQDGALLRTIRADQGGILSLAITSDGGTIVSGGTNGQIRIWQLSDGRLLRSTIGHSGEVHSLAISTYSEMAVSGGGDGSVLIWKLPDLALLGRLGGTAEQEEGCAGRVWAITFAAFDQTVISCKTSGCVEFWSLPDRRRIGIAGSNTEPITSVAADRCGETCVTGGWDGAIRVWQMPSGSLLRTFTGPDANHAQAVTCVAVTPNGKMAVSSGLDNTIKVWRLSDGRLLRTLTGHARSVWSIAITPDGKTVVSGSYDKTIKVWRLSDGALLRTLTDEMEEVRCIAVARDGSMVISGAVDGTMRVWRLLDGQLVRTIRIGAVGGRGSVESIAVAPDNKTIVSGDSYGTILVWRLADGRSVCTLPTGFDAGHSNSVENVLLTSDGQTIVSGSRTDNTIKVWRLSDGRLLRTLTGYSGGIAMMPDGRSVVSGADSTIRLWRISDGQLLRDFPTKVVSVRELAVTPDGQTVISGDLFGTLTAWRLDASRRHGSDGADPAALTAPPSLSIAASFEEPSGNRALDAFEEAALVLRVRNTGRGPAARLRGVATGHARGVTLSPPETVALLQPGAETTLRIPVRADGTVRDGTVRLRAVVEEAHGFNSDTVLVEFETRAERPPALAIARVALDDDASGQSFGNGDNTFQAGETAELTLFVQNTGTGAAEGVSGTVSTAAQYVYILSPQDGRFTVGDIPAGEYREVPVVVTVAPAYRGPNALPVTITLADRRTRYRWENLPLGISLGARTATVQTLRVQAAAERSAGLVQLPPELQRAGAAGAASRPDTSFRAAVVPLECPGLDSNAALTLTDHLRLSLHQTGVFQVMERARMEEIMEEQAFILSPCTSTSCAVEVGQILDAPYIITGRVGKVGDTWSVTLSVVDVETSHIPAMASQTCSGCELGRLLQDSVPQAAAALAGDMLRATMRGR